MTDLHDAAEYYRRLEGADYAELERKQFLGREQRDPRTRPALLALVDLAFVAILLGAGYVVGKALVLVAAHLGWWQP